MTTQSIPVKKTITLPAKAASLNNGGQAKPALEDLITRIDAEELRKATENSTALLDLLHRHKAPAAIFRIKDDEPRKLHANVRSGLEALNAALNCDALISALRVATDLPKQSPAMDLLLYLLGPYDLHRGPNGKVIDAFFWARDRGVQAYLEKHCIPSTKTAAALKDLGGVDATYRLWCEEKKESSGLKVAGTQRVSLEKAALEKVAELKVGERVCIEAELVQSKKLKFVRIHKCVPEVEGEIVAETPPALPVMPALPAPAPPAGPTGAH